MMVKIMSDSKRTEGKVHFHVSGLAGAVQLGFFIGKLGREKVCVLYEKDVVFPSDYKGVIYYSFQDNWKLEIAKELKASGINIETDNILNC